MTDIVSHAAENNQTQLRNEIWLFKFHWVCNDNISSSSTVICNLF